MDFVGDWGITANIVPIWETASQLIAGAAIVASVTPAPKDDSVLRWVRNVLDTLAFNFNKAKNAK